jgi:predicted peptidase
MNVLKSSTVFLVAMLVATIAMAERDENSNERSNQDPRVLHKSYTFEDGEEIPYAVFVPSTYDKSKEYPLIVSLHGLTRQYDWLMGYHGFLDQCERDGYIMVTPLGYVRDGWYGSHAKDEHAEQSEQDVMNVFELVRKEYNIDEKRIYLWGHSMGGAGTYHLAARYPDLWAALGVVAPAPNVSPDQLEKFKHIPIIAIQGDDDRLVAITRRWVKKMEEIGMQHVYIEIPGGDHSLLISQNKENMAKVVNFFNIVRKN